MNDTRPTICLNMIVRNEARVIERCLSSVKHLVSHWAIVDTGSTDGTQQLVRDVLRDLPGDLIERPWVDFAHNRNEALDRARGRADWVLFIDADEVLSVDAGFTWPALVEDAYRVEVQNDDLSYERILLARNDPQWRYRGVLHEQLVVPPGRKVGRLRGLKNLPRHDGARSSDPNKYKRDALLLESALLDEPDNSRYAFYLAQSYRDAGAYARAHEQYLRRAQMGGPAEETWYALYQAALMQLLLGEPWERVLTGLLDAHASGPRRAEPLYHIANYYSQRREPVLAGMFAREAARIPRPEGGMFVETSVYGWGVPFELALYHAWAGEHGEAVRLFNQVMRTPGVPPEVYAQSMEHRRLSAAAYPRAPVATPREPRLKICVPILGPGHFLDNCVDSLIAQRNVDFHAVFFDVSSTGDSSLAVPEDDPRLELVRCERSVGTAEIVDRFLREHCEPDDVFVLVDGRDWLAHEDALSTVARLYASSGCQVLYGQYREANGRIGRAQPYPDAVSFIQRDRERFPHLMPSFRAGIYQANAREMGGAGWLREPSGDWPLLAWDDDRALMDPVLRHAGFDRVRFNDEVLYVLNTDVERPPR